jgi:ATP-dependent DNA helicase DinG
MPWGGKSWENSLLSGALPFRIRQRCSRNTLQLPVQLGLDRREQGFGRLVRTAEDWGRVVILDPRVLTKPYGRVFLDSLPPAKLVIEPYG